MKQLLKSFRLYLLTYLTAFSIILFACTDINDRKPPIAPVNATPSSSTQFTEVPMTPFTDIGDGGFLSKQPCGPPCFFGITPDINSEDDVLLFLQENIGLSRCLSWDSIDDGGTRGISCDKFEFTFTFQQDDIVDGIGFIPHEEVTINEVIAIYGNPNGLSVVENVDDMGNIIGVRIILYYDSIYTRLDLPEQVGSIYEIIPETLVASVSYLDRSTYDRYINRTKPWAGYGEYPASSP